MSHEKILEAALFISSKPLMLNEIGKILGVSSLGYVKEMLEKLQKDYEGKGIEIVSTPQGWTMQVKSEFLGKVAHLTPYSDISEGSKRALAVIAYKEPVLQSEIIKIQGNKAYSYLKDLRKRNLISMEKKGHTKQLTLTSEFERYFGEEKEHIKERLESSQRRLDGKKAEKTEKPEKQEKLVKGEKSQKEKKPVQEQKEHQKEGDKPPSKREEEPAEKEPESPKSPKKSDIDHILE